jgi:hypothetical protein
MCSNDHQYENNYENKQIGIRCWVDVSPTEYSLMLRPLNKASLGYCVPDRCVPTLDRVKHGTSFVGLRHLLNQWGVWPASPTPLTRFIGLAPLRRMHARPTHRTPPLSALKRAAVGSRVSLRSIQPKGWDGSVRGKIAKGHFVQVMQHPRIFGRVHIGRGWINIAPGILISDGNDIETKAERSFDLGFIFNIEAKRTCLFQNL